MNTSILALLCVFLVGCAHQPELRPAELIPSPVLVADGVQALIDQRAPLSDFARFSDPPPLSPKRLHRFASVGQLTARYHFSAQERAQQRQWFESAAEVWYYQFAEQYAAVLFTDGSGHVQHALLLG